MPRNIGAIIVLVIAGLVLAPSASWAQEDAGIGGRIVDDTGGVLPGVSVNVTSPALLADREAFSDASGNFLVTNLHSGEYTVTFTLQGFGTVVREGVTLQGAFVVVVVGASVVVVVVVTPH